MSGKTVTARNSSRKLRITSKKPQKTAEKNGSAGIDFCGVKLTALRRAFIIQYVTPGQPCFHNAYQAAIKAGYKRGSASGEIYRILNDPDIQKIIRTNESLLHQAIHDSAMRALEIKQRRAFFDPADYFEQNEITLTTKDGNKYTKETIGLKPLENMTLEQRLCIDGIETGGQGSTPIYKMANREKELNDIIKIDQELSKTIANTDEEETREIIMERVIIRETKRAERPADIEYEIVERAESAPDAMEEED